MSNLFDTRCPSCNSKQLITSESSGSRVTLTCVACGHSFKASDNVENVKSFVQKAERNINTVQNSNDRYLTNEESLKQRALQIAQTEGVISAIKYWKDNTNSSLKETKEYIEKLLASRTTTEPSVNLPVEERQEETVSHQSKRFDQQLIEVAKNEGKLQAVKFCKDQKGWGLKDSVLYVEKVVPPEAFKKREGCFIATACYGDYNAVEVLTLRRYRDEVLLKTAMGKAFVRFYYAVSPSFVKMIEGSAFLKNSIRNYVLRPLVKRLQK